MMKLAFLANLQQKEENAFKRQQETKGKKWRNSGKTTSLLKGMFKKEIYFLISSLGTAPWRKRLVYSRLPPQGPEFASRSLRVGFVVDETEYAWVFLAVSPASPCHKFNSTISLLSSRSFHFIRFPCAGAAGLVGRHPCYSQSFNSRGSIEPSTRPYVGRELRNCLLHG